MSVELSETVRLLPSDNNKNSRVRTNLESFDSIVDSEKSTKCSSRLIGACLSLCIGIFLLLIVTFTETDKRIVLSATLSRTTPYKVVSHTEPVTGLWGTVTKPYPTGAFWTNLVVKTGDGAVGVHPYGVKTLDMGVQVSYGATRRWVSPLSIADSFACDLQLSSSQGYLGRSVESFDNISVTMSYKVVGGKYKTHLVKSSPFVTVVYEGATPVISSELMKFLNVEAKVMQNSVGSQYIVTLGNFQKWLVYCSEPVAFTWKDNTLTSPAPIRGFVRVAILPNNYYDKAFNVLLSYVLKYPTGASLNLTYPSGTQSTVTIQYHTVGTGSLLMLALPHHASVLEVPALNSRDSLAVQAVYDPIWDIKGKLIAVVGDVWKLQYSLVQAGWNYIVNDKLTNPQLDQIAQSLMVDVKTNLPNAADSYSFGKQIGRLARLAVIADNLGIADARQQAIVGLQNALVPWLTGANPDALMYDKVYGGLITTNGFSDPNAEFGTGWYNDHHFHYGYFINAGAVLARLSPPFFEIYRAAFDTLVRDICNYDAGDPDFPIARHKDFFDGHSWASGLFQQANGKGQESSSEAVNAYYGVYLYALATANTDLLHFSHTLLTMEVHSAKTYWHMQQTSEQIDQVFTARRMLGNLGALDKTTSTWFGSKLEYVHGINMMPLSPATAALFERNFVKDSYPVLATCLSASNANSTSFSKTCSDNKGCNALGLTGDCCPSPEGTILGCCDSLASSASSLADEWKAYVYADLAVVNRDKAWDKLLAMNDFGIGNSKTNCLLWTATQAAPLSNFDETVVKIDPATIIDPQCSANSACNAIGMLGSCCPASNQINLGCCPKLMVY